MKYLNLLIPLFCFLSGVLNAGAEFQTTKSESIKVWMNPIEMTPDGSSITRLTIFENDIKDYSAFNMALVVPEGITVATIQQGRETISDIRLSQRAASTHTISCNMLDDGQTIKIISYSLNLDNYYNDDTEGQPLDSLFSIGLKANSSIAPGEYTLELYDIKFVEQNTDATILPEEPVTTTLTIHPEITGLQDLEIEAANDEIYDLLGRRRSSTTHGVNIINRTKVLR